ncbi:MAG TPA: hypothetical protein PKC28_11245, partial [Bdellovibrionales bacterium]|nr:hypothetical protein [Bdellovibrionales bacterium]
MSYGSRFGHGILVGILLLTPLARAQVTGFSSLELNEEPGRERLWKGEWKFEIGGHKFEEGKDQGAAALLYFTGKFEYSFAWWLKARVTPRVDLFTSRVQERYDNDTYSNRLRLIEGVISIQPFQEVELNAGAINQRHLDSPMLVSGQRSFPGLQQVYQRQFSAFGVELNAQQVVPTSTSLNTEREDEEALPS